MSAILASLIPTFLIIATGWLCRATNFVSEPQWAGLERVTYVIFFPALIIDTLSRADLSSVPVLGVGGALVGVDPDHGRSGAGDQARAGAPVRHRRPELHLDLPGRDALEHLRRPCGGGQPVRAARHRPDRGRHRGHGAASQPSRLLRLHPLRRPPAAEPVGHPALLHRQSLHLVLRHRACPQPAGAAAAEAGGGIYRRHRARGAGVGPADRRRRARHPQARQPRPAACSWRPP